MKAAILVAVVSVLTLAGCSSSSHGATAGHSSAATAVASSPSTFSVSGEVTLYGSISTGVDAMTSGAPCMGITNPSMPSEDYEDVVEGAPITVTDGSGATVGVGQLGAGTMSTVNPPDARVCSFSYSVDGITAGRGFYRMTVGDHSTQTYPEAEFKSLPSLALRSALYSG